MWGVLREPSVILSHPTAVGLSVAPEGSPASR